jgi:hypothetical protein
MLRRYWDANTQHPFAADGVKPHAEATGPPTRQLPSVRRLSERKRRHDFSRKSSIIPFETRAFTKIHTINSSPSFPPALVVRFFGWREITIALLTRAYPFWLKTQHRQGVSADVSPFGCLFRSTANGISFTGM